MTAATLARPGSPARDEPHASSGYDEALGGLRAFVVFLVVLHHSVLGYFPGAPEPEGPFVGGAMLWRVFPVLDPARWSLAPVVVSFDDVFFMALLFLLSGLFVPQSVQRRGVARFVRDRLLRLGLPFLFSALIVTPIAYYASYLQSGGEPGLALYWHAWRSIGYWPTSPAWFVLVLLLYDLVAAALFLLAPGWAAAVGRLARDAHDRPARLFWIVASASFVAYASLVAVYGPEHWTNLGLLQFQTSRIVHYFVYFAIGIGIGAAGRERGLVAADGMLARRFGRWTVAMIGAFVLAAGVYLTMLGATGETRAVLAGLGTIAFALSCAASSFAFLALFTRFARRPSRLWRSVADDSYGVYLVHYAFVAWCQYALLGAALPGVAKAALVTAVAYALSLAASDLVRRIPGVARIV